MIMKTLIDVQSLLDTHEKPFLVIDDDYGIVAVNQAFEESYRVDRTEVVGRKCHQVSHGNERPCYHYGEECPHRQVYASGKDYSCLHIHHDNQDRVHQVRVTMHPLEGPNGEMLVGEIFDELSVLDQSRLDQVSMVGASEPFLRTLEQLKSAAKYDAPVLLQGETGTGKELAANFIHENSGRRERPFLTLDCTVLTETLFESEVFGHERGAFTGSIGEKQGLFELADGGTLFLDEVGEMSPNTQAKMLRVLESGEFRRVGGTRVRRTNARIICATNRDLKAADWFRDDLFYRVACLSIRLPSLRERTDDLPLLAEALLERIGHSMGRHYRLTAAAQQLLRQYHYPGNIRELRNILWAAATQGSDGRIERTHLETQEPFATAPYPPAAAQRLPRPLDTDVKAPAGANDSLEDIETHYIEELLEKCAGNRRRTAEHLGISERTLYRKLKRYNLS